LNNHIANTLKLITIDVRYLCDLFKKMLLWSYHVNNRRSFNSKNKKCSNLFRFSIQSQKGDLVYNISHASILSANHPFIPHNFLSYFAIALKLPALLRYFPFFDLNFTFFSFLLFQNFLPIYLVAPNSQYSFFLYSFLIYLSLILIILFIPLKYSLHTYHPTFLPLHLYNLHFFSLQS